MKISALDPLVSGFTPSTDMLPIVHSGKTWRIAGSDLVNYLGGPYVPTSGGPISGPISIGSTSAGLTINGNTAAISTDVPPGATTLLFMQGTDNAEVRILLDSIGTASPVIIGRAARGTGAARTEPILDQPLLALRGHGMGRAASVPTYSGVRAAIELRAAENWSGTAVQGTYIAFSVTPKGTNTAAEGMRLADDRTLLIGKTTSLGLVNLEVAGGAIIDTLTVSNTLTSSANFIAQVTATANPAIIANTTLRPLSYKTGTLLEVLGGSGATSRVVVNTYAASIPSVTGRVAAGTVTAPTAIAANQTLLNLAGDGYGASGFGQDRALIELKSAQAWTDTVQGTYIAFSTTTSGTITTVERVRITDAGILQIGSGTQNILSITPGAGAGNAATLSTGGSGSVQVTGGLVVAGSVQSGTATMPGGGQFSAIVPDTSLDLNFLCSIPDLCVFTRASGGATYFDANGVMQTAATDVPRFDYDPITRAPLGLLLEESRTNIAFPSTPTSARWALGNVTLVSASGIAPDNTNTMTKMADQAITGFHCITQSLTITASQQYTFSVFLKMGEIRYVNVWADSGALGFGAVFDLQNGVISGPISAVGGATAGRAIMQPVGKGVYRCSVSGILGSATTLRAAVVHFAGSFGTGFPSYAGVAGNGTYMWGLQVEAGTFPTSLIQTSGAAANRAIDLCTMSAANVAQWFTGTPGGSWLAEFVNFNPTPVNPRVITRPDSPGSVTPVGLGTTLIGAQYDGVATLSTVNAAVVNTVTRLSSTWAVGQAKICMNGGVVSTGTTLTNGFGALTTFGIRFLTVIAAGNADNMSGYLRRLSYWPRVLTDAEMQSVSTVNSRLSGVAIDGVVIGGTTPAAGTFTQVTVGSGTQDILTITPGATPAAPVTLAGSGSGGIRVPSGFQTTSPAFTGTAVLPGGATVAQAVPDASLDVSFLTGLPTGWAFTRASAVGTYFDATGVLQTVAGNDIPRFDYDPVSHAPRGLLVEEARTNTMLNSDALGSFSDGSAVRSFAQGTAPNGTNTAVKLTEDTSSTDHAVSYLQATPTANTSYTASAFFKAGTRSYVVIEWRVAATWLNGIAVVVANLNNGTIFSTTPGVVLATITPAGNGWYRVSVTATTVASAPPQPQLWCGLADNSGNVTYVGNGTSFAYCWGVQVEVGTFPTSYISAAAASVTRAIEALSLNVGTWYDATKGSLLCEYITEGVAVSFAGPMALVGSNANNDYIDVDETTTSSSTPTNPHISSAGILVGGTGVASGNFPGIPTSPAGAISRGASSWTSGGVVSAAHNGVVNSSTTGTVTSLPTITRLGIGLQYHFQPQFNLWVRRAAYWPRQLSQAELQAVSSTPSLMTGVAIDASPIGETTPANGTFLRVKTGSATGPTWTTGSAAPLAAEPVGSLYSRAGGAVGATLYVSRGGGTWAAVAGV